MGDPYDDDYGDYDQYAEDQGPPCPRCDGHRTVNCYCGGDQCYCENYGEKDCPLCYGEGVATPERAEKYLESEREMMAVMRKAWEDAEAEEAMGDTKSITQAEAAKGGRDAIGAG